MAGQLPSGLGNAQQATQATAFIRSEPWYLEWLQSHGITPGPDQQVRLDDNQRAELMSLAVQHGIGFNDKYDMIDENGQIAEEHHKLKKVAIAAALAGLAVTGLGAAGIGPLAGALGGATTAATAASPFAASATGGGVLAGLPGAMAALPAIGGAAGTTAALGAGGSALTKIGSLLGDVGKSVGDAGNAANQDRLIQESAGLDANKLNTEGQNAYQSQVLAVDKANTQKTQQHLRDQLMSEKAVHPSVSPFDVSGGPTWSPEYKSALAQIAAQNPELLAKPVPYTSIDPKNVPGSTGTTPSTLSKIGQMLSPALSVAPKIAAMF